MDFQHVICVAVIPSNRNAHVLRKLKYLRIQGAKGCSTCKGFNNDTHYTQKLNKKQQHHSYLPEKNALVSPLLQAPIQPLHCSMHLRRRPCSMACHTLAPQRRGSDGAACDGQGRVGQSLAQTEIQVKKMKEKGFKNLARLKNNLC